jgi:hypothetical protein
MTVSKAALGAAVATAVTSLSAEDGKDPTKVWTAVAGAIWDYFKANIAINIPATGIAAPNGSCTGASTTGTIS